MNFRINKKRNFGEIKKKVRNMSKNSVFPQSKNCAKKNEKKYQRTGGKKEMMYASKNNF